MPVNEQSDCEAIKGARSARLRVGYLRKVNLTAESQIDLKFLMIWFILVSVFGFQGTNVIFLDSSMVEHSAVNRGVVGSSPTRGVFL